MYMTIVSNIAWQRVLNLFLFTTILLVACGQRGNRNEASNGATPTATAANKSLPAEQNNEPSEAQEYQGEVTALRFLTDAWSEANDYSTLIDTFETDNPDVKIEVVTYDEVLGDEPLGGVELVARLVSAADVVDTIAAPAAVAGDLILDLTPFFEEANLDADDFYPGTLESAQWNGGTWYFPVRLSPTVLFYDKDAFDNAGLPYPEAGWSWNDFLATAEALTVTGDEEVAQWGFVEPTYSNPALFIESRTGPLLDPTAAPPVIRFDDTAVVDTVRWYVNLFSLHEVSPYFPWPEPGEPAQASILIAEGKAAMWVEPLANWENWRERAQRNVGVVPFPVDSPGAKSTPMQVSGYIVSAGTEKPDAAWRWLLFLSENVPPIGNGGASPLPARRAIAEAGGFWESVDEEVAPTLRYALEHAYVSTPGAGAERYVRQAIEAILSGEQSVESALSAAQATAVADREEMTADMDPADDFTVATPAAAAPVDEDVTAIEFMIAGSPSDQQMVQSLATTFQETHPDIAVQITPPDTANEPLTFGNMAGQADCFQWSGPLEEGELNAVISLEPLLDADPALSSGDFFPTTLEPFTYQGELWGVPGHFRVSLVAFNKVLFNAAGLPYPEAGWTAEEMRTLALALTTDEGEEAKQYGYLPGNFAARDLSIFLDLLGAQLVDDSQAPPALTLNHAATVTAMRWYTGLATEHGVMPLPPVDVDAPGDWQQREELIENGRAAMWMTSSFDLAGTNGHLEVGFVPLPLAPGGRRTYQSATGYFIAAGTDRVQSCWQWMTFLVAQPVIGGDDFTVPALRAAAESAVYRQAVGEERAAATLNTITDARQRPLLQRFSGENSWLAVSYWWLAEAYGQVLHEGLSVEEALATAQEKADAYRECLIAHDAFDDAGVQQACLRQVGGEF